MLAAYIAAAGLCAIAARKCRDHPRYRGGGAMIGVMHRERLLWQAMAALLAILAIYRQFDFADLVTGLGRAVAVAGNWYAGRRPLQVAGVAIVAIVVIVCAAASFRWVAAAHPLALAALGACTVLVLLLGINVLSLHGVDTFLRYGFQRARIYNVIESGSLATILGSTLLFRRQAIAG